MTARSGEKELAGLALQQPFGRLYSSGLPLPIHLGSNIFSLVRPSPLFFFPLSPIGRTGLRALVMPYPDAVIWSSRTPMRDPGIPAFVIPHIDVESRKYRQKHLQNTLPLRPLSGPRIACGVTPFVIPHSDVVSRNIRGGESLLLFLLCHELDPASLCGVTPLVIPRFDAVSRNIWGRESPLLFLLCHELDPASIVG